MSAPRSVVRASVVALTTGTVRSPSLDLTGVRRDREVGDEGFLGLAGAMRYDAGMAVSPKSPNKMANVSQSH